MRDLVAELAERAERADALSARSRDQLAAEVILLTHRGELHEANRQWHPAAEALLWRPDLQEPKTSQARRHNLRYRLDRKRGWVEGLVGALREHLPVCRVRYAFSRGYQTPRPGCPG